MNCPVCWERYRIEERLYWYDARRDCCHRFGHIVEVRQ